MESWLPHELISRFYLPQVQCSQFKNRWLLLHLNFRPNYCQSRDWMIVKFPITHSKVSFFPFPTSLFDFQQVPYQQHKRQNLSGTSTNTHCSVTPLFPMEPEFSSINFKWKQTENVALHLFKKWNCPTSAGNRKAGSENQWKGGEFINSVNID